METTPHGIFHWNELLTDNVETAKTFFADTVGWTYTGMPMAPDGGTYWVAMMGDRPVGGIMPMQGIVPEGVPPHWMSYLCVDDIDTRLKGVEKAGGKIVRAAFDVPSVGRIAIIMDASGAALGWITPVDHSAD